jgi:hypothetical protein
MKLIGQFIAKEILTKRMPKNVTPRRSNLS